MGKQGLVTARGIIATALADYEYRDATFEDVADDVVQALGTAGFRIVTLAPVDAVAIGTEPVGCDRMPGASIG